MVNSHFIPCFKFTYFYKCGSGRLQGRGNRNFSWVRPDLAEVYWGALSVLHLNPSLPSWSTSCKVFCHPVTRRNERLYWDCNLPLNRSLVRAGEWLYITQLSPLKKPVSPPQCSLLWLEDRRASSERQIEVSSV